MRTGHFETDLRVLGARLAYLPDLIAAKREPNTDRCPTVRQSGWP
jgi:hypothetical protein